MPMPVFRTPVRMVEIVEGDQFKTLEKIHQFPGVAIKVGVGLVAASIVIIDKRVGGNFFTLAEIAVPF